MTRPDSISLLISFCLESGTLLNRDLSILNRYSPQSTSQKFVYFATFFSLYLSKNRPGIVIREITQSQSIKDICTASPVDHLVKNLPGIVFSCETSNDWSMKYLSAGCQQLTGYEAQELLGSEIHFNVITHPDDLGRVIETINRAVAAQQPYATEYRIRTKSGEEKWLWEKGQGVFDDQGRVLRVEGLITDISAFKGAERELQRQRNLLQAVTAGTQLFLRAHDLKDSVNQALALLGQAAEVDRIYIYQNHPHPVTQQLAMSMRYEWTRAGIAPSITQEHWQNQPYDAFGMMRWYQRLSAGQSFTVITRELPAADQELLLRDRIRSILLVPILIEAELWGYIGFDDCHQERQWTPEEESILMAMAASISEALKRAAMESALQDVERKYYDIFENAVEGIFQSTYAGQYIKVNPALARIYGYTSPAEMLQSLTSISDQLYINPQRRQEFLERIQTTGTLNNFESQIRRKDGSIIWISENTRAVTDNTGQILYFEGFVEDITERKQAEVTLRRSEERYALAIQGANDGLWDWNLSTQEIYYSPRWKTLLGFESEDLPDTFKSWSDRIHPEDLEQFQASLAAHLARETPHFENEHRLLHRVGHYLWVLSRGVATFDDQGHPQRMAGSLTNISRRKQTEAQLMYSACHDTLTGLANRFLFLNQLQKALHRAKRSPNAAFAVLFLDLDRFKVINDSLGHSAGDDLLQGVGERLQACVRASDTVSRWGGDEFAILLDDLHQGIDLTEMVERVKQVFTHPFQVGWQELFITASIGIVQSNSFADNAEDLLRAADIAMYRAKSQGRACHAVFDPAMHEQAVERLSLETDLRHALERQEFQVYFQPVLCLKTGTLFGMEALIRWQSTMRGLVSPAAFLPAVEDLGLIVELDRWVMRQACEQLQRWRHQFPWHQHLTVSVNLSSQQFLHPDFVTYVEALLPEVALPPTLLNLEITESVLMEKTAVTSEMLLRLKQLGIKLHIDDFGTGYSSLGYLHRFPVDTLKIDQSFVRYMEVEPENREIVTAIAKLAHNLRMGIVVEGVETVDQMHYLQSLGCEHAQGYLFSQPLTAAQATELLADPEMRFPQFESLSNETAPQLMA